MRRENEREPTLRSGWRRSCEARAVADGGGRVSAGPAGLAKKQEGAGGTEKRPLSVAAEDPAWRGLPHAPTWKHSGPDCVRSTVTLPSSSLGSARQAAPAPARPPPCLDWPPGVRPFVRPKGET